MRHLTPVVLAFVMGFLGAELRAQLVVSPVHAEVGISPGRSLVRLRDGTAAAPSLSFLNDAGVGLYRPAASQLGFSASLVGASGNNVQVTMATDNSAFVGYQSGDTANASVAVVVSNATPNIQFGPGTAAADTQLGRGAANRLDLGTNDNLQIPNIASVTGVRYLCVNTAGLIVSQAAACVGT